MKLTTTYNELQEVMAKVVPACARDDTRPVLTGVYVEQYKDHASYISADGFRLVILNPELIEYPLSRNIVTVKSIREAIKEIETEGKKQHGSRNKRAWQAPKIEVELETIKGMFPNYKKLVPKDSAKHIIELDNINRFADAIDILKVAANKNLTIIRMSIECLDTKTITLLVSANYHELNAVLELHVPLKNYTGDNPMKIAANVNHLEDICKALKDSKNITIEISSKNSPILVKTDKYIHVVMPMNAQW